MAKNPLAGLLFVRAITALLMTVAVVGCAAQPTSEASRATGHGALTPSQEKDLLRAHDEWIDVINRGDTERGLAGFAEDAAIIGPEGPISQGTEELRQNVARLTSVPGLHVEFMLTKASVSDDDRLGFVVGDSKITAPGPDGTLHITSQRLLTVWRKDGAGKWRCYLDVVIPAAAGSAP